MNQGEFPRSFGRYTLRGKLGQGGMGTVYRAFDSNRETEVAIKVCAPGQASIEEATRLVREARVLAEVRHPHLVNLLYAGNYHGTPYLVMELIEGENLRQRLRREGALPPDEAVRLVAKLAQAAGALHRQGVVHRDVKPANVLLDANGKPLLTDLGLARDEAMSRLTQTGAFVGTPAYLSPEQVSPGTISPASDVYAFGVLLFELVGGRLPFSTKNQIALLHAHLSLPAPSLGSVAPGVSRELERIVARCLAKDPAERFADGDALAAALDELGPSVARSAAPRREQWVLVVGALLALTSASGALWLVLRQSTTPAVTAPADPALVPPAVLLEQGEQALSSYQLAVAEALFREAVAEDPTSALAWSGQGQALSFMGRSVSALRSFERALELDAGDLRALLGLARVNFGKGNLSAAQALYDRAAATPGAGGSSEVELLRLGLLLSRDPEAALAEAKAFVARAPRDANAWFTLAQAQRLTGRNSEAFESVERGLGVEPIPQLYTLRLVLGQRLGRSERERKRWRRLALETYPEYPDVICSAIADALDLKDYAWVDETLAAVFARGLELPRVRLMRAQRRWGAGDLDGAVQDMVQARDELRDDPTLAALEAEVALARGEFRSALAHAQRAAELAPQQLRPHLLRFRCALEAAEVEVAAEAAERCWELRPSVVSALRMVEVSFAREDHPQALAWCARGQEIEPDHPRLQFARDVARLLLGEPEALEAVRRAAEEGVEEAHGVLVRYYFERGQLELGQPHLERALAQDSKKATTFTLAGDYALARGEHRRALEAYEQAFARKPRSVLTLIGLARTYHAVGAAREASLLAQLAEWRLERSGVIEARAQETRAVLAELVGEDRLDLELSPEDLVREGDVRFRRRDPIGALAAFRAALVMDRQNGRAWFGVARGYMLRGLPLAATAEIRQAQHFSPLEPDVLCTAALLAAVRGDRAQAESILEQLAVQDPQGPWVWLLRAELAWREGRSEETERFYRAALKRSPTNPRVGSPLVAFLLRANREDEVIELLEGELGEYMQAELGEAWRQRGDPARARAALERAVGRSRFAPLAHSLFAHLELRERRYSEARVLQRRAVQLDPLQARAWMALINLDLEQGRDQEAARSLELLLSLCSAEEVSRFLQALAEAGLKGDRWPRRRLVWAKQAVALQPASLSAQRVLSMSYVRAGETAHAVEGYRRVLELAPTEVGALAFLAGVALDAGDLGQAVPYAERLMSADPQDWRSHAIRGRLRLRQGSLDAAWADLEHAVSLAPLHPAPRLLILEHGPRLGRWAEVRAHAQALLEFEGQREHVREVAEAALARASKELAD